MASMHAGKGLGCALREEPIATYPLLRRAVASPLMVSRMPRCTSSSVSPQR